MAKTYEFHEVASIFPLIEGKEFSDLVEDVKKNGLYESIWLYEGKIIDGRNHYRACLQAGVSPTYRDWDGNGSLVGFVVSLNLKRRHLDAGQKAIVGQRMMPFLKAEAKERMEKGVNEVGAGGRGKKNPTPKMEEGLDDKRDGEAAEQAGKIVGVGKQYIYEAKKIMEKSPETAARIMKNETTFAKVVKEMKIEDRKVKIAAQKEEIKKLVVPNQKYNVVVIDPPWEFKGEYDPDGRRLVGDYPTMSFDEIKKMKLPIEDDCVLWLWGVDCYLKETLDVIESWGFERKATLIWVKDKIGLGAWLRNKHEYCFLCVKGKPKFYGESTSTILEARRGKHSEKPDEFYALVDKICPYPKKLDYFARKKREGWDVYGDEIKE